MAWLLRPTLCTPAILLLYWRDNIIKEYEPVHELCAIVKEIPGDIQNFFELVCHTKCQDQAGGLGTMNMNMNTLMDFERCEGRSGFV